MDPTIGVTFDGQPRISLVQGEDRTIQLEFRDVVKQLPINLTGGYVTMRLPSQGDAPILRSSLPQVIPTAQVSVPNDTITSISHGFVTGDPVTVTTSGTFPAPLAVSTNYLVQVVDDDTFQLSDVSGSLINITSQGTGAVLVLCPDITVDTGDQGTASVTLRALVTAALEPDEGQSFMVGINIGGKQRYVIVSNELDVAAAED
jgi:hypothetical protein